MLRPRSQNSDVWGIRRGWGIVGPTMLPGLAASLLAVAAPTDTATVSFPDPGSTLTHLVTRRPKGFGRRTVYLDAGHGTGTNSGARTVACTDEADLVLEVARGLEKALVATGDFAVTVSRKDARGPSYKRRLARARAVDADVLLSLHADARGTAVRYERTPGQWCLKNAEQPGFSILFSDEGSAPRVAERRRLARAVAGRMAQAGFVAYDGFDYGGLYLDDAEPGVFIDRRGLFMLRRPPMPSVIIETLHALHPDEYARWQQTKTREAFYAAVVAALYDTLSPSGPTGTNASPVRPK